MKINGNNGFTRQKKSRWVLFRRDLPLVLTLQIHISSIFISHANVCSPRKTSLALCTNDAPSGIRSLVVQMCAAFWIQTTKIVFLLSMFWTSTVIHTLCIDCHSQLGGVMLMTFCSWYKRNIYYAYLNSIIVGFFIETGNISVEIANISDFIQSHLSELCVVFFCYSYFILNWFINVKCIWPIFEYILKWCGFFFTIFLCFVALKAIVTETVQKFLFVLFHSTS